VLDGAVITPDYGMLEGVTRKTVIQIAQFLEIPVHVRAVLAEEFRSANEVFISTSGGGVLPVTRVDGNAIGNGEVGAITRKLVDAYWALHKDPSLNLPIVY
jgi:branched-chain amino acid aminotransferase